MHQKIRITYYVKGSRNTTTYDTTLPLRFGFGSFNEPYRVMDIATNIWVEDIKSIDAITD